jgi:hypothetical protein
MLRVYGFELLYIRGLFGLMHKLCWVVVHLIDFWVRIVFEEDPSLSIYWVRKFESVDILDVK